MGKADVAQSCSVSECVFMTSETSKWVKVFQTYPSITTRFFYNYQLQNMPFLITPKYIAVARIVWCKLCQ